ncbi:60S ribosomal protein L32 isoform 3-like protein [Camelus ferus]|nr:60S ribosomal protein L32 isoform 3-like protein [Camelus ferus]
MTAPRYLMKPKIIKKKTKKFIQHQSDWYVKIKRNGQKSRGIANKIQRLFKGQIWMPNIVMAATRKQSICCLSGF